MSKRTRVLWVSGLWLLWLAVAGVTLAGGVEYYATPRVERAFSPLHTRFSPAGVVGHGYGVVGTAMVLFGVVMYSARKRWPRLAGVGRLKHWLEVHIFLCTLGPFLVLLHTSFKFGGLVSIAFWSMVVVVTSGVVGRYLYVRIPKTIHGHVMTLRELQAQRQGLTAELGSVAGLDERALGVVLPVAAGTAAAGRPVGALLLAVRSDLGRRGVRRRARRALAAAGVPESLQARVLALAEEQARVTQAIAVLGPFQRLFRYWHVFHLPLAILMLLIVAIHVAVAVAFGYTWLF